MRGSQDKRRSRPCLLAGLALLALLACVPAPAVAQLACTSPSASSPRAADPGISPDGAGYRLLSTSGVPSGLQIRSSADGVSWCSTGTRVFAQPPGWIRRVDGKPVGGFWAPELRARPGGGPSIVVYAAMKTARRRCIGLAVGADGSYRDRGAVVCEPGNRYIDGSIFFAPGGTAYLLYKEDPRLDPQRPRRVKRIMIRTIDLASVDGDKKVKLGRPHELLRPRGWEDNSVEAPTMVHHGGRYSLFYSGGLYTTRRYGIGAAVSNTPTGGFKRISRKPMIGGDDATPKGKCGLGHQDVTHTQRDGWRMYYHLASIVTVQGKRTCDVGNRRLAYRPLSWGSTGKPRLGTPASANTSSAAVQKTCVKHPREASVVCVRKENHVVDVCDRDNDGHRVYARVITDASSPSFRSQFYDDNDSKAGCANIRFASRVASVAVCVQFEGCSAFQSTTAQPPPAAPVAPAPQPGPAPPPAAKDVCATHPSDASVVCTRNAGHTVDVCDRDADGHRAYARVVTQASSPNFQSPFYDNNDSRSGCANIPFSSRVLSVAVCVQYEGCSALKPT